MRFFPLFFRLVHQNCLIFGTKVNLDNTYTLAILKLFGKFLIPLNPLNNQKFKISRDKSRDPASRACSFKCLVNFRIILLVRRRIRKNLEFSPRLFVCPLVTRFLRIPSLLFSETLQLVRDQ